jgi:hypothetical protein
MAASIPTSEPQQIAAGDTASWKISLADYPASGGWVLSYVMHRLGTGIKIVITASASSDDHLVAVPAAETAQWQSGEYDWQAYATKDATAERYQVGQGRLLINVNFSAAEDGFDARTTARKTLDALDAAILKLSQAQETATKGSITSWSAEGLSITRSSPEQLLAELIVTRDRYKTIVTREERLLTGRGRGRKILVRFTTP